MSFSREDFEPKKYWQQISQTQVDLSSSESQSVMQAQAGDREAFELLFGRYYKQIYRFLAHMMGDDSIGEELTQETFIKAWRALPSLRDASKFPNWLYTIAYHLACDCYRQSKGIHQEFPHKEAKLIRQISITGPEEQVEAQETLNRALALVLPEKSRACLILYYLERYSEQQIAEFLGIKQSSVRQYISLGLNQLKRFLKEERQDNER